MDDLSRALADPDAAGTVCVVDDDASLRRALARLIGLAGFRVIAFDTAEALLPSSDAIGCGCLVLDVHLGGVNGFDVYDRLITRCASPPVIFVTAVDNPASRERARVLGGRYMRKPVEVEALIDAIRRCARVTKTGRRVA